MKQTILVVTIFVLFLLGVGIWRVVNFAPGVASFEDCVAAGYPVMESYPEQCRTPDGRLFVREVRNGMTLAGGEVELMYPSEYGLAVSEEQLLVRSYIPACDQGFEYCLYYYGTAYEGTNFESAGMRINRRFEFAERAACLTAQPEGYQGLASHAYEGDGYATVSFPGLGDAAAGHYSNGSLYRLWSGTMCYEFETRVAQSQFLNYEPGAIQEFTNENARELSGSLDRILQSVRLNSRNVVFPESTL